MYRDNRAYYEDQYFSLKAEFEELRLYDGTDPEYLNDLRHRMDEALNTMNDNNSKLLEGERVVEAQKAID